VKKVEQQHQSNEGAWSGHIINSDGQFTRKKQFDKIHFYATNNYMA